MIGAILDALASPGIAAFDDAAPLTMFGTRGRSYCVTK
jgi:hypothetical protein